MLHLPAQFQTINFLPTTLFIVAGIYAVLALYGWHRRQSLAAKLFAGLMLAVGIWSLGYGFEIAVPALPYKILWAKFQYLGIEAAPFLWLTFALEYTGRNSLLTRRNVMLFSFPPLVILAFAWTNEFHHLIWVATPIVEKSGLQLIDYHYGWMVSVNAAYSYIFMMWGSILMVIDAWRAPRLYRAQAIATIIAVIVPLLGNLIYLLDLFPGIVIDVTMFFFIPSGIALAWAITRYRLLDIIPPAQSVILQSLSDAVVLVDQQQRILFMNHAAETIFAKKADEYLGQPATAVFTECNGQITPLPGTGEEQTEYTLIVDGKPRQYEIRFIPMRSTPGGNASESTSHLIIFHDATKRKQTESALRRHDAILQAVSLAGQHFLKQTSWEQDIPEVLERLGMAAEASRAYIFERSYSENGVSLISQQYEWVGEGISSQIDNPDLQNLDWRAAGYARWEDILERRENIHGLPRDFPVSEKALLSEQNILSIAVMPVFDEDKLWGFIGFDDCKHERDWSDSELEALRAAADIFGAALTRRNIELRLLKRQHSQQLLQEIIRTALGRNEIREMAQFLVDHLASLIGADHCYLSLWEEMEQRTIPVASYGVGSDVYRAMQIQPGEKTLTASALAAGHLLIVDDALNSPFVSPRITKLFKTKSVLAIPMISNEIKLGAVLLGFEKPHRFTPEEIILSEQAADLVALALAKIRAVEEAQRRAEEAETLRRAGVAISETLNLQEATTRILEQLAYVLPHDSASVQLLRDGELEIIGGEGWADPASIIGVRFLIPGNNPNTVVIQTRKPYLIHDIYDVFPEFRNIVHATHIRSWLGVPLIIHNQVIGLLAIDSRETHHFTADNAELATAFAGQVAIAIENARLFDEVQQLAITDGLTGLFNRRHFFELARSEFERARRYKRHLSVMIFDIDHFKKVNDTHGHPVGDQVLRALAALCKEKLREVDPIGRYGGEEFIALVVEADARTSRAVAERLRCEVEKMSVPSKDGDIKITVSVGISEQSEDTPTLDTLIARADQAMYVAKHKGRNRVAVGK